MGRQGQLWQGVVGREVRYGSNLRDEGAQEVQAQAPEAGACVAWLCVARARVVCVTDCMYADFYTGRSQAHHTTPGSLLWRLSLLTHSVERVTSRTGREDEDRTAGTGGCGRVRVHHDHELCVPNRSTAVHCARVLRGRGAFLSS